jgi:hypothetical protein
MLTARVSAFAACAVLLTACGDDAKEKKRPRAASCPAGTAELTTADMLPDLPPATSLVQLPERVVADFRPLIDRRFGDRVRSAGGDTLIERRRLIASVLVVNTTRRNPARDAAAVSIAEDAAHFKGAEAIDIDGQPGLLMPLPGSVVAAADIAPCASVVVVGANKASVRRVASKVRTPD